MHQRASLNIEKLESTVSYSGSKLALLLLMKYVANMCSDTAVNAVDPLEWVEWQLPTI